jgi:hypothetical protein
MRYELKPLGVGGILDQTIRIVRDRFGLFLGIVFCLRVPATAVLQYLSATNLKEMPRTPTDAQMNEFFVHMGRFYLYVLLPAALIDLLIISPMTNGALIFATSRIYLGEAPTFWDAMRAALRRYFAFVWTSLLFTVLLLCGLACCVLPGILVLLRYSLCTTAAVLERVSGTQALSRGSDLMKGPGNSNYLKLLLLYLVMLMIQTGVNGGAYFIPQLHVQVLAIAILGSITYTFAVVALVIFYYSCRCSNEGFDLLHLARIVAETPAEQPVLSQG